MIAKAISAYDALQTDTIILCEKDKLPDLLDTNLKATANRLAEKEQEIINLSTAENNHWVVFVKPNMQAEALRKLGNTLLQEIEKVKTTALTIYGATVEKEALLSFTEGFLLGAYQFLKYFKEEEQVKKKIKLEHLEVFAGVPLDEELEAMQATIDAVFWARDLVNEPLSAVNASSFAQQVSAKGAAVGLDVEVLDKKQIESLRMGGLLAVNRGSIDPPTFTIATWKPENAINTKPYVLVGKGVMFDTGGLSLKPTANSMDLMKSDMGGAAAIAATLYGIAKHKLPLYVIGLMPATDNRPSGNAYTPGEIVKMFNGLHVEVLNTDAEGRMILADAISYADKFDPEFVLDMATLTGSAAMALGTQAAVMMGTAETAYFEDLQTAGDQVHERLIRFPFFAEYDEMIKSKIADLKNLGGRDAGAITAGKFLANFTSHPFIHIDIAGPAFLTAAESYRTLGGSGYGVRLLLQYFKNRSKK